MNYKKGLLSIFMFIFVVNIYGRESFKNGMQIIASYDNSFPEDIKVKQKFEPLPRTLDYVFVTSRVATLRKAPKLSSKIIGKYTYDTKLKLLKKVKYRENYWYEVEDENTGKKGYMAASNTKKRSFRFETALEKIHNLENFVNSSLNNGYKLKSVNTYAPNPNNSNLKREQDKYGNTLDQNLVGFNSKGERIFIPDRSVVKVLSESENTAIVKPLSIPETLQVNKNRLTSYPNITTNIDKVIAIDIENQNFIVFEKNKENNKWEVISYVYTKTGFESQLGFETPKGYFTVPMVKYLMPYNDENGQKQGSAKYAMRFSGGGYVHGTPINVQEEINREFFMERKEFTLGTTPGTRKCVRTSEEHAKFLFDWAVKNPIKTQNIQRPSEKIYFVNF